MSEEKVLSFGKRPLVLFVITIAKVAITTIAAFFGVVVILRMTQYQIGYKNEVIAIVLVFFVMALIWASAFEDVSSYVSLSATVSIFTLSILGGVAATTVVGKILGWLIAGLAGFISVPFFVNAIKASGLSPRWLVYAVCVSGVVGIGAPIYLFLRLQ